MVRPQEGGGGGKGLLEKGGRSYFKSSWISFFNISPHEQLKDNRGGLYPLLYYAISVLSYRRQT